MLNQERVKEMTKMAVFDERDGKRCKPMIEYLRKDYVAKEMIKSFVTGTIAFILMGAVWGIYNAESLLERLTKLDIRTPLTAAALLYILFMGIYFLVTYLIYNARYTAGRQDVKKFYAHLKKVNNIYQKEEQL